MILKRVTINDTETYVPISFDDAIEYDKKDELIFTDADEKDKFEDRLEELDDSLEKNTSKKTIDFDFANKIISRVNKTLDKRLKESITEKCDKKTSKMITVLPFMDDEDIHEIVEGILNGDELYKDLNLTPLMPFFEEEDCDKIFRKLIIESNGGYAHNISSLAPFVSEECLSSLVDEYLDGKYPDLSLESLLPFLDSKDVKKIFKSYLKNRWLTYKGSNTHACVPPLYKTNYYEKIIVCGYAICAYLVVKDNDIDAAYDYLLNAYECAKRYDKNPTKIYFDNVIFALPGYDEFAEDTLGKTALESIEKIIDKNKLLMKKLNELKEKD